MFILQVRAPTWLPSIADQAGASGPTPGPACGPARGHPHVGARTNSRDTGGGDPWQLPSHPGGARPSRQQELHSCPWGKLF